MFFIPPVELREDHDKDTLAHALGATLYMPGTANRAIDKVINNEIPGLTSTVLCLEDAVDDREVEDAEENLALQLGTLLAMAEKGSSLPFIFVRVRNVEQFKRLTQVLGESIHVLTGFVFPKFDMMAGQEYFAHLTTINKTTKKTIYGMPILEGPSVIHLESRVREMLKIKELLDQYKELVLNVRMGATDLSGLYGLRRSPELTIYDVSVIRDFIADMVNIFGRPQDGYVISGPVWEYFNNTARMLKPQLRKTPFQEQYGRAGESFRLELLGRYIDGLMREVMLDKANGLVGKTIIHPSHILPVQAMYVVTHEEYCDAKDILANGGNGGVTKSVYGNKMNEAKPHINWAKKIMILAKIYGVLNERYDYTSIIYEGEKLQNIG
ncbi:putative ATP/GTP-binding protein [Desulforamulus reducens MI-1]|uniref:Putative ATP/GTP-binding protein n=2 Tax=Desulforamulus TaxID=2916693 RepID=A4J1D5_DESRM|nr:putative ATP/GTP-binding protein [Desulforamulus reducens MI-1]